MIGKYPPKTITEVAPRLQGFSYLAAMKQRTEPPISDRHERNAAGSRWQQRGGDGKPSPETAAPVINCIALRVNLSGLDQLLSDCTLASDIQAGHLTALLLLW